MKGKKIFSAFLSSCVILSSVAVTAAVPGVTNISGVDGTQFGGGNMKVTSQINFADLFEGDGSNGTNGTVAWTITDQNTGAVTTEGLKATKVDNGIKFSRAGSTGANPGRAKAIFDKTYELPQPKNPNKPYYLEVDFGIQAGGAINFDFGRNTSEDETLVGDTSVARIRKLDDYTGSDSVAGAIEGPAAYSLRINDTEKAKASYSAYEDVSLGLYVDPANGKLVFYKNGSMVEESAEDFSSADTALETLRVTWNQNIRWYNIPEAEYLTLESIKLYEDTSVQIQKGTNLALNKTVTGSSDKFYPNYPYSNITDGSRDTRLAMNDNNDLANNWIQIDLGSKVSFNQVNIVEFRKRLKQFKFQYSNDGSTWTDISGATLNVNNEEVKPYFEHSYTFNTVTARYFRLYIMANVKYNNSTYVGISIYEIEIYNTNTLKSGFYADEPYITTKYDNGDVTVKAEAINLTDEAKNGCMIVMLYDKETNELIDAKIVKKDAASQDVTEFSNTLNVTDSANQEIRAVFWDGSDTLIPLTDKTEFKAE